MLIEHQCARLQTAYAIAADQGDVEAFVQCFAEDGVVEVPGSPAFSGHAAIRASIVALGSLGVTYRHVITNSLITVESSDRARGICYLVTFNSSAPADDAGSRPIEDPGTVGEYVDRFVRTSAGWRIGHRALRRVFRREDAVVRAAAELARRG
ncbi:MAG: nuclear transport factor 2 family protein [Pseudomonadales bacterium]|nr:nuclear transport factor 2 family protein [Pseudomonadales bacterium]